MAKACFSFVRQSGRGIFLIKPLRDSLTILKYRDFSPLGQGKIWENETNETQDSMCIILRNETIRCPISKINRAYNRLFGRFGNLGQYSQFSACRQETLARLMSVRKEVSALFLYIPDNEIDMS